MYKMWSRSARLLRGSSSVRYRRYYSHFPTAPLAHVDTVEVSLDEHRLYPRNQADGQAVRAHGHRRVNAYWKQQLPRFVLVVHRRKVEQRAFERRFQSSRTRGSVTREGDK